MLWKYAAFLAALALVAPLPRRVGYFIARIVADLSFLMAQRSREKLFTNLRHVLGPNCDENLVKSYALEIARNTARNIFDVINMPRLDPGSLEKPVKISNWEHMAAAVARGKGVVLASIHMGNMDMSIQIIRARGVSLTILAEVEQPEQLYRLTRRLRSYNGISILPVTYSGIKEAMKRLRQGETVAIACDRAIQGSGEYRKFFGKEALLPIGGVEMAYRTGAAIVPAFTVRNGGNSFSMYFEPAIYLDRKKGKAGSIQSGLSKIVSLMEQYISRHPDQWMVYEPIWREESAAPRITASLTSGRRAVNGTGPRPANSNGRRPAIAKVSGPTSKR